MPAQVELIGYMHPAQNINRGHHQIHQNIVLNMGGQLLPSCRNVMVHVMLLTFEDNITIPNVHLIPSNLTLCKYMQEIIS